MDIFFSVILISGIYAVSRKKHILIIASLIGLPTLAAQWSLYFLKIPSFNLLRTFFGALFFAYALVIIISHLFREKEVTMEVITSSVCAYFMIGIMWAFIFSFMEILHPGSFSIEQSPMENTVQLFYYSFVTLTTLGYGDITPLTNPARSLSLLEAVMGQLYLAILIARLVGIYIAQSIEGKSA